MGEADQSRIVADAAKARYWNVSMAGQDPALLRRLLRAKDRMDAASSLAARLAALSAVSLVMSWSPSWRGTATRLSSAR